MTLFVSPRQTEPNLNGIIAAGWTYYFYEVGTTTPKTVYSDSALTTALGTSVESVANGRFPAIFYSGAIKVVLKDAEGVEQWTEDNYNPSLNPIELPTLTGLQSVAGAIIGSKRKVGAYYSDGSVKLDKVYTLTNRAKSLHNGGTIISPTAVSAWDGAVGATHTAFLAGTGETDPAGTGVWELEEGLLFVSFFGAVPYDAGAIVDSAPAIEKAFTAKRNIFVDDNYYISRKVTTPNNTQRYSLNSLPTDFFWIVNGGSDWALEHSGANGSNETTENCLRLINVGFTGTGEPNSAKGVRIIKQSHGGWNNVRFNELGGTAFEFEEIWNASYHDVRVSSCGKGTGEIAALLKNTDDDSCFNLKFYGLVIEGASTDCGPRLKLESAGSFSFSGNSIIFFASRIGAEFDSSSAPDQPLVVLDDALDCHFHDGQFVNCHSTTYAAVEFENNTSQCSITGEAKFAIDSLYAVRCTDSPRNDFDISVASRDGTASANISSWVHFKNTGSVDNVVNLRINPLNASESAVRLSTTNIVSTNDTANNTVTTRDLRESGQDSAEIYQSGAAKIRRIWDGDGVVWQRATAWNGTTGVATWQEVFRIHDDKRGVQVADGTTIYSQGDPTGALAGEQGDLAINRFADAGEPAFWQATVTGSPATWVPVGQVGYRSGTTNPSGVLTPLRVGEEFLETTTPRWYKSTGLLNTNWVALN